MSNMLKRSLKARLFVTFLIVAVVSVAILGSITYLYGRKILRTQVVSGLVTTSELKDVALRNMLRRANIEFKLLALDYRTADLFEQILSGNGNISALKKEMAEYVGTFTKADPGIEDVFVMDMNGRIVNAIDKAMIGVDESAMDIFTEGKKRIFYKDFYISQFTGRPCWVISGPMMDKTGKRQLGVFAIRYDVKPIFEILESRIGLGESGESYIVNREGVMISNSRFIKDAFLKQRVDTEPVKLMQSKGEIMSGVYKDYRGHDALGASMGEDVNNEFGLGWTIISEIDVNEAFAPVSRLGLTILIVGIVLSMGIAVWAYFIASAIAAPVQRASAVVKRVGDGDLSGNVETSRSEDEIGVLNNSIRATIEYLRTMVTQTLNVAERVSASSQQLSSSAQEMNATTEEVSATVQEISKGTETQAQKVEETQKIMEQMAASVSQVSRSAQETAAQAAKSADVAQKQREASAIGKDKMVEISEAILKAAAVINRLGERSDQIGEIVGVITGIADQTNLLALNAAIEAARAGEYGRGFAVVAEEVRKLAEGSAKAADEIAHLIKEVQKESLQAVNDIKMVSKESIVVRELAQQTEESLLEVVKSVESVAAMIEQVSASSQEQATGARQVSQSVSDIAAVAEETASATEEASASAEEMTASMEEMAASAQELADMGIQLRDLVARFKVSDDASFKPADHSAVKDPERQGDSSKLVKIKQHAAAMRKRFTDMRAGRASKGNVEK